MAKDERSGFADPEDFRTVPGLLPVSASTLPSTSIGPFQQNQQDSLQAQVQRSLTQDTSGARNFAAASFGNARIIAASDAPADEKATAWVVCDGFEDENEINNAFTDGYSVRLTSGTYPVNTGAISVPSNRSLTGQGAGTIIQAGTGYGGNMIENGDQTSGNTNILLADFVIDGNDVDIGNGVELDEVSNSVIDNVHVKNGGANSGQAIEVIGTTTREVSVTRVLVEDWAGSTGISVGEGKHVSLKGNRLRACFVGIELASSPDYCTVEGNIVADSVTDGIVIAGTFHDVIGNVIYNSAEDGLDLIGADDCNVSDNIVVGNSQTTDATSDGIFLATSDRNNIQNNVVRHGGGAKQHRYGINISDAGSADNLVTNNDIRNAGRTGNLNDSGTGTLTGPGNNGVHTHASASTGGQIAAASVTIADAGNDFTATTVEGALDELQADAEADATALSDHLADSSDAHDASAISVDSTTLVGTGTDVQAVLEELDNGIADHLADSSDAHDASAVSNVPAGTIAATTVQAAIDELDGDITGLRGVNFLVGTATGELSAEIAVGTAPGGELGNTWASPTVDTTHSGSAHSDFIAKAFVDAKGDLISASAADTPAILTVGANDTILMADSAQTTGLKWVAAGTPVAVDSSGGAGSADTFARGDHGHAHEAAHINHDTTWAAKGDLIGGTANDTAAVLTVGADGSVLVADSTQTTGLIWKAVPQGVIVLTPGDFIASQGSPALTSYLTSAGTGRGQVGWAMDGASDEAITTTFRLPADYNTGHLSYVNIRFFLAVAAGASQDVRMGPTVTYMTVGDTIAGSGNNTAEDLQTTSVASGAQYQFYEQVYTAAAPVNALAADDSITLTILRRGGQAADDYNSDIVIVEVAVGYPAKFGA